ncbi:MAG TPA: hypothetical protein VIT65_20825 [Microlunatus sp.]
MFTPSGRVTDLEEFRSRKRQPAGSRAGGRFAAETRTETGRELHVASDDPDPWSEPAFTAPTPDAKLSVVRAAVGVDDRASSASLAGTCHTPAGLSSHRSRDRLSATLRRFADAYAKGFGGSMEEALTVVDRLSADVAEMAPCLSADRHRQLASMSAKRIVRHVDQRGPADVGRVVQECLDEAGNANQDAYDRGLRAPTKHGR